MMTFNAAEREVCIMRKDRTNTPLQALTLMNNIAFVEAARFLAERVMVASGDSREEQWVSGFQFATGRLPDKLERDVLRRADREFLERYRKSPDEALRLLRVGQKSRNEKLDVIEHAAMTMTASLNLNLDETITRE